MWDGSNCKSFPALGAFIRDYLGCDGGVVTFGEVCTPPGESAARQRRERSADQLSQPRCRCARLLDAPSVLHRRLAWHRAAPHMQLHACTSDARLHARLHAALHAHLCVGTSFGNGYPGPAFDQNVSSVEECRCSDAGQLPSPRPSIYRGEGCYVAVSAYQLNVTGPAADEV